ncbi:MAG: MFS transporter [Euryhalocaulis sp.]|uniref:spinster family MFS transporter n=1 Tax=Euryhalocaulis sp. TaxID=2744307 RepID=UPI0017AA3316|nr:MFS transporter [Euryhalocaulis sp.]MBA4800504.1 MFS transporter [Euryhalocaulis sp.]
MTARSPSIEASDTPASGPAATARPGGRAWWTLGMLCFVYVLNFLDRQLLSILAKPIQDDLGVTDGQLGLIGGLYFALFYCLIAIPVGWLADKTNRVRVLGFACFLWSAATIACGLSRNYPQLVIARMTVGIGEAGGVPPSYAIISDYFPSGMRGRALGLYNMGPPIGAALGVAFGASIAAAFSWRDAFVSIGIVGVVTALAVLVFVREPKRGGLDAGPVADTPAPAPAPAAAPPQESFRATCKMFFAHPSLRLIAFASGATQFVTYAVINFTTLFLMREKGMTLGEIAIYYALLLGLGVSAGMYVSGRLVDWLSRRTKAAYAYVPAAGLVVAVPFFIGFVWAPTWPLAMAFLTVPTVLNYFYLSPAVALVQEGVKPNQRVLSGALLLLVMNLIGLGLGPTYLGAASDFFRDSHPDNSLQIAFYTLIPFYFLAIALFLWLGRILSRETEAGGRSR